MRRLLLTALLSLSAVSSVFAKDWRGIVPLYSTRETVETLLGPPPLPPPDRSYTLNTGRSIYFLDEGEVYIVFADDEFLKGRNCLSVAPGTVLMIQITPKELMPISELRLDQKTFRGFNPTKPQVPESEAFIDDEAGLIVRSYQGKVQELVYIPTAAERKRCPAYYETPEEFVTTSVGACGLPFDQYGDLRFSDEKARLDNFAIPLQGSENTTGYIIVYAGRKATVGEARTRANRARDYLITVRHIDPGRVIALDGGYTDALNVYLLIAPPGVVPPLSPTVDPKDVELIYEKPRTRRRPRHQD